MNKLKVDSVYEDPKTGERFYIVASIREQITVPIENCYIVKSSFGSKPILFNEEALQDLVEVDMLFEMMLMLEKPMIGSNLAKIYAIDAHNRVNHMYGKYRYSKHLHDVVQVFRKFEHLIQKEDQDIVEAILWLHDCIEDAMKTFNDILKQHGEIVATGVYAMTNGKGRDRSERAGKAYYNGLKSIKYGEFYKLCDRIANVSAGIKNDGTMIEKYRKEYPHFKEQLKNDPHYEEMWDYLNKLIYGEFEVL